MLKHTVSLFLLLTILLLASCEGSLEPKSNVPTDGKTLIYGDVNFKGTWPHDSLLKSIRVVVFKQNPPGDIVSEVLSGNAFFTEESLEFYKDKVSYEIEIKQAPETFRYIAVAQQYGSLTEWKAIGVFHKDGSQEPNFININKGEQIKISLDVDFDNLPKQPF